MPTRVFLSRDEPLLPLLVKRLLPASGNGPLDLGDTLILTPTRQAGRRFREELARAWRERGGTALLSTLVRPPSVLFQPAGDSPSAHPLDILHAWTAVLTARDPDALPNLLPGRNEPLNPAQALEFGRRLQTLREELADADRDLQLVHEKIPLLSEQERWQELARLEQDYRRELAGRHLQDPCDNKRAHARNFKIPPGVKRIVLAGVPDPSPLALLALEHLDARLPVECWIHAPPSEADSFDEWGRPGPEWRTRPLGPATEPEGWIELLSDPEALCRRVAELLSAAPPAPDLAFGLLDAALAPRLTLELQRVNRSLYNPGPVSLTELDPVRLLGLLREAGQRGDSVSLRALWRHPDLLRALTDQPEALLRAWDRYAAEHVPSRAESVDATLADPLLRPAWERLRGWMRAESAAERLQALREIYAGRKVGKNEAVDRLHQRAAQAAADILQEAARRETKGQPPSPEAVWRLLRDQSVDPLRVEGDVTAEGWLELSYHPAPRLMLLGMQEGVVPGTRVADPFLPDGLRAELGLRSDRDWLARDAFLLHALCDCRPADGVRIFCMKRDEQGGPLRPSRLLFQCGDTRLLARASLLFGELPPPPPRPHAAPGLMLQTGQAKTRPLERLSVTSLRAYLACPTRFYLSHILRMRRLDDLAREPDAAAFGNLLHCVLERGLPPARFEIEPVCAAMDTELDKILKEQYGPSPGMAIEVLRHSARARLHAAARVQHAEAEAGWVIRHREIPCEREVNGVKITGILDRLDEHPSLGWRIVDYKTSDSPSSPKDAHLGTRKSEHQTLWTEDENGRAKQWTDLQLPLYRWLAGTREECPPGTALQVAYFQLPKAVNETALVSWEQEPALADSALAALDFIVNQIRNEVWGPPAERMRYDDFEALFHHGGAELPDTFRSSPSNSRS